MPTSGDAIKASILKEMESHPGLFNIDHPILQIFIECVAKGVYEELKNLDDNAGFPPSTGHK
ncbi:MAG: hypothetical protein GY760_08220 [Deltaproteobacteria bacterium]|nr:hypothetical protein [Deltaproteobacteria bacterium]